MFLNYLSLTLFNSVEQLLQRIPKTAVYIDDILISVVSMNKHDDELHLVFTRLQNTGVCLKNDKSEFQNSLVTELIWHLSDKTSLCGMFGTCKNKLSYLTLINYYYMNNVSLYLALFHMLLQKEVSQKLKEASKIAFEKSKKLLMSFKILMHYNNEYEFVMTVDASSVVIGAKLSHILLDRRHQSTSPQEYYRIWKRITCKLNVKNQQNFFFFFFFWLQIPTKGLISCNK